MFRGFSKFSLDGKGRMALPARHREALQVQKAETVVLTMSPLDRAILLYPIQAWAAVEQQLDTLSDLQHSSRRTKQMMRGHASDCSLDAQGRVSIDRELREYAGLTQACVCLGQGNKLEIWDAGTWQKQRAQWLLQVEKGTAETATVLGGLSL